MARPVLVFFQAGPSGPWAIERLEPVIGEAPRLTVTQGQVDTGSAVWTL